MEDKYILYSYALALPWWFWLSRSKTFFKRFSVDVNINCLLGPTVLWDMLFVWLIRYNILPCKWLFLWVTFWRHKPPKRKRVLYTYWLYTMWHTLHILFGAIHVVSYEAVLEMRDYLLSGQITKALSGFCCDPRGHLPGGRTVWKQGSCPACCQLGEAAYRRAPRARWGAFTVLPT